jgi:4-amino-4-deoxy-L-arabinose transferase-like glycosyltransferase
MKRAALWFWAGLAAALLASRAAHLDILWADEDYHLAVALQVLDGKLPYRDVWYDKPPLTALLATLTGGWPGWPLRIASTILALAASLAAYRFARDAWGPRQGFTAAFLLAFFQIFGIPNAVLTFEPDTLLLVPHLLAVHWAWQRRGLASGIAAGAAFLIHPKAIFLLPICLLFAPGQWLRLGAGFLLPNSLIVAWLIAQDAWTAYIEQVWKWGLLYASSPPEPIGRGWLRLAGWTGFHAALWIGAVWQWRTQREDRARWIAWVAIALPAAILGWRFAPRYLSFLLPPLVMAAAAGLANRSLRSRLGLAVAIALAIPAARFGPRYALLAAEELAGSRHTWLDVYMDQESRDGAALIASIQRPGDTIFVWGYRPNIVVYTRLPVAGRLWDSQPVTGVPADRHLGWSTTPLDSDWAARNRRELIRMSPAILVDGLSEYNPRLAIRNFPDLAAWFARYCRVPGGPPGVIVYRLCAGAP